MQFQFQDKLSIKSKNEIGELSSNINQLSERMEGYINQLKTDLEKEKKLEQTRKDFIAGVSHELKRHSVSCKYLHLCCKMESRLK